MTIKPEELELARARIRQWPLEERKALTRMTEHEARAIALLTALLDIRPEAGDSEEETKEAAEAAAETQMRAMPEAGEGV